MLKNFESETRPLTEYEISVVLPVLVSCLEKKVGKENVISNAEMVGALVDADYRTNDRRVRKIINKIRIDCLVNGLVATNLGYYVATTEEELFDYEESLLGREDAIRAVRLSIRKQRKEMFKHEQQSLVEQFKALFV